MTQDPIVITAAVRTAIGGLQGMFAGVSATQLGSAAIAAAVQRGGVRPEEVQEVLMGCVLPAGLGQAPARQAARGAGLPDSAGATTLNKVCGSGLKAVMLAHDLIKAESAEIVLAGGMESMSNAPYLLPKARAGYRFGHGEVLDHMALDGLEDAYEKRTPMGLFAEHCVERYGFSRGQQDEYALRSLSRARQANEDGSFDFEMVPFELQGRKGVEVIGRDEQPFKASPEKIPTLKPAFKKDGTITAANASSISDGAAALLLMRQSQARQRGISPLARIVGHSTHARLPAEFTIAPVHAISALLGKLGWTAGEVNLWEINEAFACVTMAAMVEHRLSADRVNIHGGACALGHPIGASGARILTTLIGALRKTGGQRGIASLCIGGGEAVALAVEML